MAISLSFIEIEHKNIKPIISFP